MSAVLIYFHTLESKKIAGPSSGVHMSAAQAALRALKNCRGDTDDRVRALVDVNSNDERISPHRYSTAIGGNRLIETPNFPRANFGPDCIVD
jgi:hypothetical protein